jgi:hypothetical protein
MDKDRRKNKRRQSDQVMMKTVDILKSIERVSRGEDVDFKETYADLVDLKNQLGRREEDRTLGEMLCSTIESIAENIGRPVSQVGLDSDDEPRKVRVRKVGKKNGDRNVGVGWEECFPLIGKRYSVFMDDGRVFRTSVVTKVNAERIYTRNSLYQIEVL